MFTAPVWLLFDRPGRREAAGRHRNRFFQSLSAELLIGPIARCALFAVRDGKVNAKRGPLIRIRVPGDGHENSIYRPQRGGVVCCPCVRDGRGHDSPVAHAFLALGEERKAAGNGEVYQPSLLLTVVLRQKRRVVTPVTLQKQNQPYVRVGGWA